MSFLILGVLLFMVVMAAVTVAGYLYWVRPAAYLDRVGSQTVDQISGLVVVEEERAPGITRVLRRVGEAVPATPEKVSSVRKRLMGAGYRSESAVLVLSGSQVITAVLVGLALLVGMQATAVNRELTFGVTLLGVVGGYFLPNEVLHALIRRRRLAIRHALPDALDLLVICVESGLGLDQAILDVSEELLLTHRELSEEFGLVNLELRAGKRRSEALRNLAERTGESELKKLVAVLIQTDRFGTSIAQSLRTHSDFMRVKRRQLAEERAAKIGVKLVFPIFFFILPSMFLVTVGPALLQMFTELFPMMQRIE